MTEQLDDWVDSFRKLEEVLATTRAGLERLRDALLAIAEEDSAMENCRHTNRECSYCDGQGEIYQAYVTVPPYISQGGWAECPKCGGEGIEADALSCQEDTDAPQPTP